MQDNIMLNTDSYKGSHYLQYPPGTTHIYSYIESRGGVYDRTVFFGLQMFIKKYLAGQVVTMKMIDEAEAVWKAHGVPFNRAGWEYIAHVHRGFLPIQIKAVPEGMVVPTHNVLATIVNTDPHCFWLTSFLETALLRAIWYPTTVATLSWHMKKVIAESFARTSDDPSGLAFKLHDFGARGVSSEESAAIGGLAHLVNFQGSDTLSAILAGKRFYGADMAGFSIPAAEHSTITSWGRDFEELAYSNMVDQFGGGLYAVVSDSYDLWNAIDHIWGEDLIEKVKLRGGTLVVRPDSGSPITTPVACVARLADKFSFTVNSKGYKVLNGVRVIQGDGIDGKSLPKIVDFLEQNGWSIDNLAFGMGGGLLQQVNRDTQKFAMKCSAACVNGEWRDVFKDPITDPGKRSKKGMLALAIKNGHFQTVPANSAPDVMVDVFRDGWLIAEHSFSKVRALAEAGLQAELSRAELRAAE